MKLDRRMHAVVTVRRYLATHAAHLLRELAQ
jgi:hypothetical protein